jgi:pilus assembly protein Flp/PilA
MAGVQGGGHENGSLERLSKMTKILQYLGDESGASAAEYALILALVAIAIIGGLTLLGTTINAVLSSGATAM